MRTGIVVWLVVALAAPLAAHAAPPPAPEGLGMWVWSITSFATDEARARLVRFCVRQGIGHLDVHVTFSDDGGEPRLRDEGAFRSLILLAGRHNITTAALRGNPRMFSARNHDRTLQELSAIIAFGESLPEGALFKGIKYDVEPYLTKEWKRKGKSLQTIMLDYLTFLRKAKTALREKSSPLWLAVDTPFWWDKEEFALQFEGVKKRFNEHVQDLTDFIVIMSYRCSAKKVLGVVEEERRYAARIGKVIFLSLETIRLKDDPEISFWGLPKAKLRDTVFELLQTAEEDPAIGGLMIHCYRSLVEKLGTGGDGQPGSGETAPAAQRASP